HPQTHPTHYNQNSSTRSQQAANKNRGKAIVNSPQPIYDQEPSVVNDDDDETSKDKEIHKLMVLISLSFKKIYKPTNNNLRTSSNTKPEQKVQNDDHYDVFAIESQHPEQCESVHKTYLIEQDARNVIIESADMHYDSQQIDQNDEDVDLAKEHSLTSQLETQKTQFMNEMDRLSREYYYADHMNAILGVYTELDEVTNLQCDYLELLQKCECLETELSKSKMMSKRFESVQKHAINLELELQQCKEKIKNDMSFKSTFVTQNNVSNDFSKPVTAQTFPTNKKPCLKNTNMLAPGMYKLHTDHTQARTSKLP
nr:hypothetical protein [Tanacetum cinerariifolium]